MTGGGYLTTEKEDSTHGSERAIISWNTVKGPHTCTNTAQIDSSIMDNSGISKQSVHWEKLFSCRVVLKVGPVDFTGCHS